SRRDFARRGSARPSRAPPRPRRGTSRPRRNPSGRMTIAILAIAGYVAGSMPFGYWLVRLTKGVDIRTVGSGNIGATNVWRTFGRRYGLPVVLLDVAKGLVPALLATIYISH